MGYAVPPPSTLGCPTGAAAADCLYPDSKRLADATHVRGGIGQLQLRWGREYAARHLIRPSLRKIRKRALQAVEAEAEQRVKQTKGSTFPPAITEQVVNLQWRRQSAATTKDRSRSDEYEWSLRRAKEDKRAAG